MRAQVSLTSRKAAQPVKPFSAKPLRQRCVIVCSTGWADPQAQKAEKTMFGENFGARNATAGELASDFSDKVQGNYDTAHVIKIPDKTKMFVGIGAQPIKPASELTLIEGKEFDLLKNQAPGWKAAPNAQGHMSLKQEWKAKDAASAAEIVKRLAEVGQADGYVAASISVQGETVSVELLTTALGGLSQNDFIVASRMNDVDVKELAAKKKARFWA